MHRRHFILLTLPAWLCCAGCKRTTMTDTPTDPAAPTTGAATTTLTDAEWRAKLTPEQFRILREAGTEAPHGAIYEQVKAQGAGSYHCAGCDTLLFTSKEKFDSGCGWPSFYDPSRAKNVKTRSDVSHGMVRTEVLCAVCGGHLGHVFTGEGFETPTDKRYCINGVALKFVPAPKEQEGKGKPAGPQP